MTGHPVFANSCMRIIDFFYFQAVRLIVIDEIHLLGQDRGPVLEVVVSRTNFISSHTSKKLRIVGNYFLNILTLTKK